MNKSVSLFINQFIINIYVSFCRPKCAIYPLKYFKNCILIFEGEQSFWGQSPVMDIWSRLPWVSHPACFLMESLLYALLSTNWPVWRIKRIRDWSKDRDQTCWSAGLIKQVDQKYCTKLHVWPSVQPLTPHDQTYRVHLIQGLLKGQSINLHITTNTAMINAEMLKTKCV